MIFEELVNISQLVVSSKFKPVSVTTVNYAKTNILTEFSIFHVSSWLRKHGTDKRLYDVTSFLTFPVCLANISFSSKISLEISLFTTSTGVVTEARVVTEAQAGLHFL
jgi:hypothetical protein